MPRYVIERALPGGVTDGDVDDAVRRALRANEEVDGVRWLHSNLAVDRSKFFCEYEAPSADAVREAARRAGIPCDTVTEVREVNASMYADSRL
jgi:hypothetical protein